MNPVMLRYLTFEKFEWLLNDKGIYFGAAKDQSDRSEGIYDHIKQYEPLNDIPNFNKRVLDVLHSMGNHRMNREREHLFISSWFRSDSETDYMWKHYADDYNGVIIVTNLMALKLLLPTPLGIATNFYNVVYDDESKKLSSNEPLRFKNECFRAENEFRIVFDLHEYATITGFREDIFPIASIDGIPSYKHPSITCCMSSDSIAQSHDVIREKGRGYILDYDINRLISEIRLPPNCSANLHNKIKSMLADSGLTIPIVRSQLG